jgi:hypothetical protein
MSWTNVQGLQSKAYDCGFCSNRVASAAGFMQQIIPRRRRDTPTCIYVRIAVGQAILIKGIKYRAFVWVHRLVHYQEMSNSRTTRRGIAWQLPPIQRLR